MAPMPRTDFNIWAIYRYLLPFCMNKKYRLRNNNSIPILGAIISAWSVVFNDHSIQFRFFFSHEFQIVNCELRTLQNIFSRVTCRHQWINRQFCCNGYSEWFVQTIRINTRSIDSKIKVSRCEFTNEWIYCLEHDCDRSHQEWTMKLANTFRSNISVKVCALTIFHVRLRRYLLHTIA